MEFSIEVRYLHFIDYTFDATRCVHLIKDGNTVTEKDVVMKWTNVVNIVECINTRNEMYFSACRFWRRRKKAHKHASLGGIIHQNGKKRANKEQHSKYIVQCITGGCQNPWCVYVVWRVFFILQFLSSIPSKAKKTFAIHIYHIFNIIKIGEWNALFSFRYLSSLGPWRVRKTKLNKFTRVQ